MRLFLGRIAVLMAAVVVMVSVSIAQAALVNGGFESGTVVTNADNASPWDWTPNDNGERVNALTNNAYDNGDGTAGPHLIDPLSGDWFGYAENGDNVSGQLSGEVAQANVVVDAPTLTFWWRFFTNETPGESNTFNDRFRVSVEGNTTVSAVVADVNSTAMISTNGPLWGPTTVNFGVTPGQAQDFALYTAGWAFYSLDVSSLLNETVTVYFRVTDVGGPHNESTGFALDIIEFVPEPASASLLAIGGLFMLRRRKA